MSKIYATDFRVEVSNIEVDDRYFSFRYSVFINGEPFDKGTYNDSHSWINDKPSFRKTLREYWATQLVIQQISLIKK